MVDAAASSATASHDRQHFRDLDGLRGVLALAVVLLHFGFNSFVQRKFGWQGFRFELAVDVFFILSGNVLTYAAEKGVDTTQFTVRRFLRLAPVFYVTTLATLLIDPTAWNTAELIMAVPVTGSDPANFPAWSVCWEFYLPVLAATLPLRIPDPWVRPLLAAVLLAMGLADIEVADGERLYLLRATCGLLAGHLLYRAKLTADLPLVPMFAGLALVMALAAYLSVFAVALPFVASLCILAGRKGGSIFASPPAQALGYLSYTLYLVHIPVLRLMQYWWGSAVDANVKLKIVGLLGSFGLAWLLSVTVERPAMRLGRLWPSRRKDKSLV